MSYHSEHTKIKLPKGKVRGDVEIVKRAAITELNEIKARLRSQQLYGNTKWTDSTILFFIDKHKGNLADAARDLGCAYMTMLKRAGKLNIKGKGSPGNAVRKWSDAQIIAAHKTCRGNGVRIARKLKSSYMTVLYRCKKLGLKLVGNLT